MLLRPLIRIPPLPEVDPMPPRVSGAVPWVGAGLKLLRNPTEFFRGARAELGDTFVADAFGYRLFCVFSPQAVRAIYALSEEQASFGLATFELVLKHKLPLELLAGRRNFPHTLFARSDVEEYLEHLTDAVKLQTDEMGPSGTFELFESMRRLGHRLGLAAWAGREAASLRYLDRLIESLERLDTGDSFVRPAQAFATYALGKRRERAAMHRIECLVAEILDERRRDGRAPGDYLDRIAHSFDDLPPGDREINAARDVMLIHMGAQSNLYAALAWTLANLLLHLDLLEQVRAGDDALLERCAYESIRLAQRSITLRCVMSPLDLHDGRSSYRLAPRTMITTMLSVTNVTAAPGLERFDPSHYDGRRLSEDVSLPAKELVSTFGHGRHTCPAQRFSISAIRIAVRRLIEAYELTPWFAGVEPRPRQIGGVARAARPCPVTYRRR